MSRRKPDAGGIVLLLLAFGFFIVTFKLIKYLWSLTPWEQEKQQRWAQYISNLQNQWVSQTNPPLIVDGYNKWIYVYTTDTEQVFNRYKVGETIRSPQERIKEQDSTSNSGELKLIAYWHAGRASDKDLHKLLESAGYERIRKNREWFVIQDPLATVPQMLALANSDF